MTLENVEEPLIDSLVADIASNPGGGWPPAWIGALATEVIAQRRRRPLIDNDLSWVEMVQTVDAIDFQAVNAINDNPGWRLLHVGTGSAGQTTLTYGWPCPDCTPENVEAP